MKTTIRFLILSAFLVCALTGEAESSWWIETEAGGVHAGRADVRIPGDTGTRFSLSDDFELDDSFYARARIGWSPDGRDEWIATYAPLSLDAGGVAAAPIAFADTLFPAGRALDGTYRFDNYRLTWRRVLRKDDRWRLAAGFTAFVRDAEISLRGAGLSAADDNVGFVPLLHGLAEWRPDERWSLTAEGDAMAAPQGRALDIRLAARYRPADTAEISLGYRILEGGADNDDVYTFALLHHAFAGVAWRF